MPMWEQKSWEMQNAGCLLECGEVQIKKRMSWHGLEMKKMSEIALFGGGDDADNEEEEDHEDEDADVGLTIMMMIIIIIIVIIIIIRLFWCWRG